MSRTSVGNRVRRRAVTAILAILSTFCWPLVVESMEVRTEYLEGNPLLPPKIYVYVSGAIENGDAERIANAIASHGDKRVDSMLFLFDSPGGSLGEGLMIGRLISELPVPTSAQVGWLENPEAICASACVYAFIGADYRYMGLEGAIGVHRFSSADDTLSSSDALDISQNISAMITAHLRRSNVDLAFFEDIVSAAPDEISWVSRSRLEEIRVLTDNVNEENVEYNNVNGSLALTISQNAYTGMSMITLLCGDKGLVAVVNLTEPEYALMGPMDLVVGDESYRVNDASILDRSDARLKAALSVPAAAAKAMLVHSNLGARMVAPNGEIFFGFNGTVSDEKIAETVRGCKAQSLDDESDDAPLMERHPGIDIMGGDLTENGIKGVALHECEALCMAEKSCAGISYVEAKRWCWPKTFGGEVNERSGIITSLKP